MRICTAILQSSHAIESKYAIDVDKYGAKPEGEDGIAVVMCQGARDYIDVFVATSSSQSAPREDDGGEIMHTVSVNRTALVFGRTLYRWMVHRERRGTEKHGLRGQGLRTTRRTANNNGIENKIVRRKRNVSTRPRPGGVVSHEYMSGSQLRCSQCRGPLV